MFAATTRADLRTRRQLAGWSSFVAALRRCICITGVSEILFTRYAGPPNWVTLGFKFRGNKQTPEC